MYVHNIVYRHVCMHACMYIHVLDKRPLHCCCLTVCLGAVVILRP